MLTIQVSNKIIIFNETTYSSDSDGYSPEDKDIQGTIKKTHAIPPPACFRTCLQCGKENPNPYFQYCFKCYRVSNHLFYIGSQFLFFIFFKHINLIFFKYSVLK